MIKNITISARKRGSRELVKYTHSDFAKLNEALERLIQNASRYHRVQIHMNWAHEPPECIPLELESNYRQLRGVIENTSLTAAPVY